MTNLKTIAANNKITSKTSPFITVGLDNVIVKGYKTAKGAGAAMKKNTDLVLVETSKILALAATGLPHKAGTDGKVNINKIKFGMKAGFTIEEAHKLCETIWEGRFELDFGKATGQGFDEKAGLGMDGHYVWVIVVDAFDADNKASARTRLDYFLNYERLPRHFANQDKQLLKEQEATAAKAAETKEEEKKAA